MSLSVVVPTLDTRLLTTACVEAVLASELPPGCELEVVVVDDGSRDGTAAALSGRPRVKVVRNEAPTGYSRAVNRGAAEAGGGLLLFLNSDTEVGPRALAAAVAAFEADPGLGIAGAALVYPDGSPQWSGGREPDLVWLLAQASGLPALLGELPLWRRVKPLAAGGPTDVGWVTGAAMAVRRAVWRDHGPFEASYRFYGQDLELCCRARDAGWRVRVLPGFRVVHHHGATIARGGEAGPRAHADLGLLWCDLAAWAGRRRGAAHGRRARAALRLGSALRVGARRLAAPLVPRGQREAFREQTRALSRARALVAAS